MKTDNGDEGEIAMQGGNKVKKRIVALPSFPPAQLSFPFVHLTLSQTKPKELPCWATRLMAAGRLHSEETDDWSFPAMH